MEYIQGMIRSRLSKINILEFGGILAILAITIPTVWLYFVNAFPFRWLGTGLLGAFLLLFLLHSHISSLHPLSSYFYMGAQALLVLTLTLLSPQYGFIIILYYVLSASAMLIFPRRAGFLWIGLFILATAFYLLIAEGWRDTILILPVYTGGFFFFAAFAYQTAKAESSRQESQALLEQLRAVHRQLQEYASQAEELAVAEERNRLAREMHDTLGHRLTVAAVQLEGAERLILTDPDKSTAMVRTVRDQVKEALRELRSTVATLRAPLQADLSLLSSLNRLAENFEEATGITVHLMLPDELPKLSNAHRLAIYRMAQESLTNVQRHARARDAWVQMTQQDGIITLLVRDNGIGLQPGAETAGFGLRGLMERAAQLGGSLSLERRAGGGTQVSLQLPMMGEPMHG